ncbi:hypothetical protein MPLSOD_40287 [Mesorhizobium sp. SOD10]|nr:hypothetical protein MPLSOD_40287 [Mesorhizobium sp. SOD10]
MSASARFNRLTSRFNSAICRFIAPSDALEEAALPRDPPPLREAPLLRDAALRGRAALAGLVPGVPVPFAAPPLLLSLSAMGFSFVPLATVGKPHGSPPGFPRLERSSRSKDNGRGASFHGHWATRFVELQSYLPQFLSLTFGCIVPAVELLASPMEVCGVFGQFLSAFEFMSPPVTLPVVPVSGAIWSGDGVAGVFGSTVMVWPLPPALSLPLVVPAVWAIAAVARPIVRAEAARILVSMVFSSVARRLSVALRLRVEPIGPRLVPTKSAPLPAGGSTCGCGAGTAGRRRVSTEGVLQDRKICLEPIAR